MKEAKVVEKNESKAKKFVFDLFFEKEGKKNRPKWKSIILTLAITFGVFVLFLILGSLFKDTSSMDQTDLKIEIEKIYQEEAIVADKKVRHLIENSAKYKGEPRKRSRKKAVVDPQKLKAKQVIEREGLFEPEKTIPRGTNLIGRLLTSIDTRESEQFYKVFLPYGGKFKFGAEIPKGSTLFGKIRYSGKGKKVFMSFSKGVFPDGREFDIQAQALSSKDYSPGIKGDFHGQSGARVAAALGLSIVAGGAQVLTERQEVGQLGATTPKPSLKNAAYGGLSQAAQDEAQRRAQSLSEKEEYVTIDAGKDLIINLTGAYQEK